MSVVGITQNGSQPSGKGPAEYFTGSVRVDPLFQNPEPSRVTGGLVTFEPGARSNWHTDPCGQGRGMAGAQRRTVPEIVSGLDMKGIRYEFVF